MTKRQHIHTSGSTKVRLGGVGTDVRYTAVILPCNAWFYCDDKCGITFILYYKLHYCWSCMALLQTIHKHITEATFQNALFNKQVDRNVWQSKLFFCYFSSGSLQHGNLAENRTSTVKWFHIFKQCSLLCGLVVPYRFS